MTWNEIDYYRGDSDRRIVLFSGFDAKSEVLVGLVGSAAHVTGMDNLEPVSLAYAQPPFWNRVVDELTTPDDDELKETLYGLDHMIDYQGRRRKDGPPKQKLEFAAKIYLSKDGLIVGSPLYVAESVNRD